MTPVAERFTLQGRTALISGGSRGIGRAIAVGFASAGAEIVLVGRSRDSLEATGAELAAAAARVRLVAADVGEREQRDRIVPDAVAAFGKVDILVNCAGAKPPRGSMLDREPGCLAELLDMNVISYHELSVAAAKEMRQRSWGRIINVSSATGLKARTGFGEYSITKAAEIMLTRALAVEVGESGITVNALAPILTRTEFSAAQLQDDSDVQRVLAAQVVKRIAEPEDVVGAALLLASDAGAFITGSTIAIDGGALA